MNRTRIAIAVVVILLVAAGVFVARSNLLLSEASVTFGPAERGFNVMRITAPYGWHCIEFAKFRESTTETEFSTSGKGMSECALFGSNDIFSNTYPDSGGAEHIPLEQPFLVYENEGKTHQIYVWITRDPANYDRLDP